MDQQKPASRFQLIWPIALSIVAYVVGLSVLMQFCKMGTGGTWIYPLDDTYIHLSIAKNLAQHGVWGVTRHAFGSASSSPVWTAALALSVKCIGVREATPLELAAFCGIAAIVLMGWIGWRQRIPSIIVGAILILSVAGASMLMITLMGMEHVAQILADVALLYFAAVLAADSQRTSLLRLLGLAILAALACAIRYEGLFLCGAAAIVFLLNRKPGHAAVVLFGGFVLISLFGIYWITHGGLFFPNSVLLKGERPDFSSASHIVGFFGRNAMDKIIAAPPILTLLIVALMLLIFDRPASAPDSSRRVSSIGRAMLLMVVITTLGHVQFSTTLWFYRYETYLIPLLLLAVGVALFERERTVKLTASVDRWISALAIAVIACIALSSLLFRARDTFRNTSIASRNIFEQQIQMARFLHRYYDSDWVVLNDIGAASFYADIRVFDYVGLDGNEIVRRRLANAWGTVGIDHRARERGAKIAIVYQSWLEKYGDIPITWIPIAQWKIQENAACGSDTVTFYVLDAKDGPELERHVKAFDSDLPADVITPYRPAPRRKPGDLLSERRRPL